MIHLSEAIVSIKNKSKAIGGGKKFKDLKTGDLIYIWIEDRDCKGTYEVKELDTERADRDREWITDPYDYGKNEIFTSNELIQVISVNKKDNESESINYMPRDYSFALRLDGDGEIGFLYTTSKTYYDYTLNKYGIEIPK